MKKSIALLITTALVAIMANSAVANCIRSVTDQDIIIPMGQGIEPSHYFEITNTRNKRIYRLEMESNGNFCINVYDLDGKKIETAWSASTANSKAAVFQDNGNLVIDGGEGSGDLWDAGTHNNLYQYNGAGYAVMIHTQLGVSGDYAQKCVGFPVGHIPHEYVFTKEGDFFARTTAYYEGTDSIFQSGYKYKVEQGAVIFNARGELGVLQAYYNPNELDYLAKSEWHTHIINYMTYQQDFMSAFPERAALLGPNHGVKH